MEILENIPLAPFTTFKIGGPAKFFCRVSNADEVRIALTFAKERALPFFILGGGSNLLVSDEGFNGLVLKIENSGINILKQDDRAVMLEVKSGEVWDKFVAFAVDSGLWGVENLSHIPGSVGAIAVQNVGAYGQEAKEVIHSIEALNIQTLQVEHLSVNECGFGYRSSIFNTSHKNKYIIFSITFVLSKIPKPNLSYRDLKNRFDGVKDPSLIEIRNAVIDIRNKKYPFPTEAKNGNAGSFFKNLNLDPESFNSLIKVAEEKFGKLAAEELVKKQFKENSGQIKFPTAALIELCGLKDMEVGGAKINASQPLVIINATGKATAQDVLNLSQIVQNKLYEVFKLNVQIEPNLLGFKSML